MVNNVGLRFNHGAEHHSWSRRKNPSVRRQMGIRFIVQLLRSALQLDYANSNRQLTISVIPLRGTTGADGKTYQMICIPLQFFPGWLFSINPDNVKEEAREQLIKYQLECNKVLFDYFFGRSEFAQKKEQEFSRQTEVVATAKKNFRDAKLVLNEAELKLRQINAMTFEEWQANERQLTIPGFE